MFKFFKQKSSLWFLGLAAYIVFMVALLPAKALWLWLEPQNPRSYEVSSIEGPWWQARFNWRLVNLPLMPSELSGKAEFDIQLLALLAGTIGINITFDSKLIKGQATANYDLSNKLVLDQFQGLMDAAMVNPSLKNYKARVQGNLELRPSTLVIDVSKLSDLANTVDAIELLEANIVWLGGQAQYPVASTIRQTDIPLLIGTASKEEGGRLSFVVDDEEGNRTLEAYLDQKGWASIVVKRQFMDVIGERWSSNVSPETTIFEVSEKLL